MRDFISGLLDTATLGILPMVELMAGYDFITGEELSSQEATNKGIEAVMGLVAIALIPFTSGGSVGLKAVGKQILVESATGVVSYTIYEAGEAMDMPAGITFALSIAGGGLTYKALDGGIPHIGRGEVVRKGGLNSYDEFSKAVSDIGKRTDLTDSQKIKKLQKLFESSNYKIDINVPSNIQYVKGFDAKGNVIYDWPPKLGFEENTIKSISRTDGLPDTWDRYGYMGGSNFADVPSTGKYTYSERAIPYVENPAAYHTGAFNNATYFDKIDAIKNGDIDALNNILLNEGMDMVDSSYFKNLQNAYNDFLEDTAEAIGSNIDATYGLKGTAASWGDMSGGAGQIVTPLNGTILMRLGIIR